MRRKIYDTLLEWKHNRKGKDASYLAQPYIIHTGDLEEKKGYLYIPPYMVPCL